MVRRVADQRVKRIMLPWKEKKFLKIQGNESINKQTSTLLAKQAELALGKFYLYEKVGKKVIHVTDPEEIELYFESELDEKSYRANLDPSTR